MVILTSVNSPLNYSAAAGVDTPSSSSFTNRYVKSTGRKTDYLPFATPELITNETPHYHGHYPEPITDLAITSAGFTSLIAAVPTLYMPLPSAIRASLGHSWQRISRLKAKTAHCHKRQRYDRFLHNSPFICTFITDNLGYPRVTLSPIHHLTLPPPGGHSPPRFSTSSR